ncbi:hypothetical protein AB0L05_24350 [Nonomuraea pusilla]|uniref:hypothetical protein n=1 Tax=Nonomuraea pusilla TaxID=46177 RepID=UPI0033278F58
MPFSRLTRLLRVPSGAAATRSAGSAGPSRGGSAVPAAQVRVLLGLPAPPGACGCLLDLPHDRRAHPRGRPG